jgi:hypothetical protein
MWLSNGKPGRSIMRVDLEIQTAYSCLCSSTVQECEMVVTTSFPVLTYQRSVRDYVPIS